MQILEIRKLRLKGSILDVGSRKSPTNVTNYIKSDTKIIYANNNPSDEKDLKINLEFQQQFENKVFDNILLFNVLEHIYNFKNCLNNCYLLLAKKNILYGSTPFLFRIHGSPNDYFRYTEQSLLLALEEAGFKDIKIKVLAGGIFISFFSSFSTFTDKIPLFNNILLIFCQLLDKLISLFSKNTKYLFPIGYFFYAKKI